MSTPFDTGFGNDDIIEVDHVKQYAKPTNDLESGAAFYREADDVSGVYQVDFQPSAQPGGHFIEELTPGQSIVFKASHNSPANAELQVLVDGGSETHPLFMGDTPVGADDIRTNQMVIVIFNDTTPPRFDVVGIASGEGGASQLSDLDDVALSSLASGDVLQYDGTDFVNRAPGAAGLVEQSRTISTSAPLFGGGDLSANRTISMAQASASQDGYLASANFATFAAKQDALTEPGDVPGLTAALAAKQDQANALDQIASLSMAKGNILVHDGGEIVQLGPGANGQVLSADDNASAGLAWVTPGGGGAGELNDLDDVEIANPAPGEVLRYDGDDFVNAALSISDVTGLQDELADKQDALTGIVDVPGLQAALDDKQDVLTATSDVPGLEAALAGKADASHTHAAGDIISGTLPVSRGGTGAANSADARDNIGAQAQDASLDEIAALSLAKGDILVHDGSELTKLGAGTDGQVLVADSAEATGLKWGAPGGGGLTSPVGLADGGTGATTAADARTNLDVPSNSDLSTGLAGKSDASHTHAATDITSGTLGVARGGTGASLSGSGGTGYVVKQTTAGGALSSAQLTASEMPSGIDPAKISPGTISSTEFGYLNGVTSSIQTQLNSKLSGTVSVSQGGTGITSLSANRLLGSGSTANTVQAITVGSGLSLSGGSLTSSVSQAMVTQAYTRTASATINTSGSWTSYTNSVVLPGGADALFTASHTIESVSGSPANGGYWRIKLTSTSLGTRYLPNSTGQRIVSPYNLIERTSFGGSWVDSLPSGGTWTVSIEMKSDSGNQFYWRDGTCSAMLV